jgi:hypothetical protein
MVDNLWITPILLLITAQMRTIRIYPPPGWQVAGAALAYYPTETPHGGR